MSQRWAHSGTSKLELAPIRVRLMRLSEALTMVTDTLSVIRIELLKLEQLERVPEYDTFEGVE